MGDVLVATPELAELEVNPFGVTTEGHVVALESSKCGLPRAPRLTHHRACANADWIDEFDLLGILALVPAIGL